MVIVFSNIMVGFKFSVSKFFVVRYIMVIDIVSVLVIII